MVYKSGKTIRIFGIIFAMVFLLSWSAAAKITVVEIQGKVELQKPGADWLPARSGMEIDLGTMISTGFGAQAQLDLGSSTITVKQLTRMRVDELIEEEESVTTQVYLNVGKVRAKVKTAEGLTHDFKLLSTVSVASVRGTDFEYDGESLTCYDGVVTLFNQVGQKRSVTVGETTSTAAYKPPLSTEQTAKTEVVVNPVPAKPAAATEVEEEPVEETLIVREEDVVPEASTTATVTATLIWPEN